MNDKTIVKINETRTKEGYAITFFTNNKSLFRRAKILLDKLAREIDSDEA